MKLTDLLAPLDSLLKRANIGYAVIGGYAVAVWGEARATRDIDLLCDAADLRALVDALAAAEFRFERRTGDFDDPVSEVVRIESMADGSAAEIDILTGIRGAPRDIVRRARRVALEGMIVPVASPEDTVVLKLLAGSPRDVEDALGVIRLQGDLLDVPLLRHLCPNSLQEALERLLLE